MSRKFFILLFLLSLGVMHSGADTVVLSDGDVLSGDVVRITDGTLVFITSLEGQLMVPMDTLRALGTSKNMVVSMVDESVHYGHIVTNNGQAQMVPLNTGPPQSIELAQILSATPIPSPQQDEVDVASPEVPNRTWNTSAAMGLQYRWGERDYSEAFNRVDVSRRTRRTTFKSEILVGHDDWDHFPSLLRSETELRHTAGDAYQPYAQATAERDINAALELRTDLALGLGKLLKQNEDNYLDGNLGLNFSYENWDNGYMDSFRKTVPREEKHETGLDLQLGLQYAYTVFGGGVLSEGVVLYPSISQPGDLRARSETAFTVSVSPHLKLRFDLLVDYNNEPVYQHLNQWGTSVGASVHFNV
jgi:hypothetical protein